MHAVGSRSADSTVIKTVTIAKVLAYTITGVKIWACGLKCPVKAAVTMRITAA